MAKNGVTKGIPRKYSKDPAKLASYTQQEISNKHSCQNFHDD